MDTNIQIIQHQIDDLTKKQWAVIIRLSALSDKQTMLVVQDELAEITQQIDILETQKLSLQPKPVNDIIKEDNKDIEDINKGIEDIKEINKEDINKEDINKGIEDINIDDVEWIIRDPMDPYKDTFKVDSDIIRVLEITNNIHLKTLLHNTRVRIPNTFQNKQAWIHITTLLHKKIVLYSVDEQILDTIGKDTLSELSVYIYTTHDLWELASNKTIFKPCIKTTHI